MEGYRYIEWKREVEDAFLSILGMNVHEAISGTILFNYYRNGYEPAETVEELSQKIDAYGIS